MSEESLRGFFADVREGLNINLGAFCDRNMIFRSDFSNFMNKKKYYVSLYELELMKDDIMKHLTEFIKIYE